jgi:SAM-dependent methyltransferase
MDVLDAFKTTQREGWAHFAPLASITTAPAARLVRHAGIQSGDRVLDVACGTGVVAVTAARLGAFVTGLDLTPELLAIARDNARIAGVQVDFHEGDCERLPFDAAGFDVVVSQFGHIFAPRPDVALGEMLRVLKTGGTIAFSTWPPELFVGCMFALVSRYLPPPPPGVAAPPLWGDPDVVRARLGAAVHDIVFDRDTMLVPSLSPQHHREVTERTSGPVMKLVEALRDAAPEKLAALRQEYERLVSEYFSANMVRQGYLMTRATKNGE